MAILGLPVPDGNYCWDDTYPKICNWFRNEGGNPRCIIFPSADLELEDPRMRSPKYLRPDCCSSKLQRR